MDGALPMNYGRIFVGGLVAGVIINLTEGILWGVVFSAENAAMMAEFGLTESRWAMPAYILTAFAIGFLIAWLYAAVRPRFGPGRGTAIRVALFLFATVWVIPLVWFSVIGIRMPPAVTLVALVFELAGVTLAALAAGWMYREGEVGGSGPLVAGS
jgi:hypothetical protein